MSITNQQIFELLLEVKQQNSDIQIDIQGIKRNLGEYGLRMEELENKIAALESENLCFKEKLRRVEVAEKKNQIVIFGLEEKVESSLEKLVLETINKVLLVNVKQQDLDNLYRIGTKTERRIRPVIVKLTRFSVKKQILQNLGKLKGTGITITNDLTVEQQIDQKILYKYFKIAKSKNFEAKIIKNQLLVNDNSFSVNDLKEATGEAFTDFFINKNHLFRNNSAPATPDRQSKATSTISVSDETTPTKNIEQKIPRKALDSKETVNEKPKEKIKKPDYKGKGTSSPVTIVSRATRQTGRTNSTSSQGKL